MPRSLRGSRCRACWCSCWPRSLHDGGFAQQRLDLGEEIRLRPHAVVGAELEDARAFRGDEIEDHRRLAGEVAHDRGQLADDPGPCAACIELEPDLTPLRGRLEGG